MDSLWQLSSLDIITDSHKKSTTWHHPAANAKICQAAVGGTFAILVSWIYGIHVSQPPSVVPSKFKVSWQWWSRKNGSNGWNCQENLTALNFLSTYIYAFVLVLYLSYTYLVISFSLSLSLSLSLFGGLSLRPNKTSSVKATSKTYLVWEQHQGVPNGMRVHMALI